MEKTIARILASPFAVIIMMAGSFWETWVALTLWAWASPWGPLPITLAQAVVLNFSVSMIFRRMDVTKEEHQVKGSESFKRIFMFAFVSPAMALGLGWLILRLF